MAESGAFGEQGKGEARGYSWESFKPANLAAAKSGAWSPRLVDETMGELQPEFQRTIADAPWIRPLDERAMFDYLRDAARLERLERWLHDHGDRYPDGHDRAGELRDRDLREVSAIRRRCMDHRSRLGLDPASRARMALERTLGVDVAQLMAELAEREREALAAADAEPLEAGATDDTNPEEEAP